ncbi:S8 family peptidase [Cohnella kolymensis]|uniref:S8 family peptidase n=1 Tax=Cohnella kolymensis TaxID=1590652 RepID=UPI000A98C467|nr:S8 family peptidase [Cohnella kolymensis]
MDTGIAPHEDLSVTGGASFVSYTASYADDNGHGTHVAGIIGARNNTIGVVGIAPDSSIYAVKALDYDGSGYLSDIIAGIDWSITNRMDLINLSLGSPQDSLTLHQVVDKAYSNGILVVAAAGNNGTANGSGDTLEYPARYESAIAVAAIDSTNQRGYFSATGSKVEVAAPGVNVTSTYLNNSYATMSGTSMATPYVTGNLALIKQANPTLSYTALRSKLDQTVVDLGAAGRDTWYGYGLIQAPYGSVTSPPAAMTTSTKVSTNKSLYITGEGINYGKC